MKTCPNCNDANAHSDYEGPCCEVCMGDGEVPNEALKTCPFCGCLAWLHAYGGILDEGNTGYRVECHGRCHGMTTYWHTEKQATDAWNQRA